MRRIIATSLLLTPMLVTTAAFASQPATDDTASTPNVRISTGVIEPRLIHSTNITLPEKLVDKVLQNDAKVVLKLNVDESGKPKDVEVIKSVDPLVDEQVMGAVQQFRWRPAMLDHQAVPMELTLDVLVEH